MPRPRSTIAPSVWTIVAAIVLIASTFMTWYETAIGPATAPDAVSGWEATSWGKLAVLAGAICLLCATVVALDIRRSIALHGHMRRVLAWVGLGAAMLAALCVVFRFVVPPNPAIGVTRELGLFLALLATLVTVLAAAAQLSRTGPPRERRPPRRPVRPARRPAEGPSR
jgi:hypothetical protein